MNKSYHDIPALLRAAGELTAKDIADRMQIDLADAQHLLAQHIKVGEVERIGRGTGCKPAYAAIGSVPVCTPAAAAVAISLSSPAPQPVAPTTSVATVRRKKFSPVSLNGYHAKPDGTVTLFLDRQVSAKSITFTVSQLRKMAADAERAAA